MKDVENKEPVFIFPLMDSVFKTMLLINNEDINEFYRRVIKHVAHIDISDYHFIDTQMTLDNYKSIFNRMDILMESSDKKKVINVECNRFPSNINRNKNNSYVLGLGRDFYRGKEKKERYKDDIIISQINLNNSFCEYDNNIDILHSYFNDPIHNIKRMNIDVYDIYLSFYKDTCYTSDDDILKDLAMFTIESFEEGDKLAKGNKEREAFMEELKKLGSNDSYIGYYDIDEYQEALFDGGVEEATQKAVISLYKNGFPKKLILEYLDVSIEDYDKYLSEANIKEDDINNEYQESLKNEGAEQTTKEAAIELHKNGVSDELITSSLKITQEKLNEYLGLE